MGKHGVIGIGLDAASAASLRSAAGETGTSLELIDSLGAGLSAIQEAVWSVTVLSLDHPGVDMTLARRLSRERSAGSVVLVTSSPSPTTTLDAVREGVVDVLASPVSVEAARELFHTLPSDDPPAQPLPERAEEGALVGSSPQLLKVFREIGKVARSSATVLVTGESGTGKELVARSLHDSSDRSSRPFVAINCAAIPENLLESELFGHERGAFTGAIARRIGRFERANGGTLFLDEIGDMSLVLQAKILRALQEREIERVGGEERIRVDVRVVAATHRDLTELIESREFREDLFYRIAVVRLHLPPLRERVGDIRALSLHYLASFAALHGRPVRRVTDAALERLEAHSWPGNVRELRNVLERAVLMSTGETLHPEAIAIHRPSRMETAREAFPGYSPDLPMAEVEKLHIARVLESVDGHLGRAAQILDLHRNTISRKAQAMGMTTQR